MRPLHVGLTGGVGAGKSLAIDTFARCGAAVMDADPIAHGVLRKKAALIKKTFGTADRKELAGIVFNDSKARKKLEKIIHPGVKAEMGRRLKAAKAPVVVSAVPLLFESKMEKLFDLTVTIEAPESVRLARARKRGTTNIAGRMRAQLRLRPADILIRNDGSKADFIKKIRAYSRAFALLRHGAAAAQ